MIEKIGVLIVIILIAVSVYLIPIAHEKEENMREERIALYYSGEDE